MGQTERIEVRKFYIGSVANFGLIYGLILGILTGLVGFIIGLLGVNLYQFLPFEANNILFAGMSFISIFLIILVGSLLLALLYNLSAKVGGRVSVGLAEWDAPVRRKKKNEKPAQSLQPVNAAVTAPPSSSMPFK